MLINLIKKLVRLFDMPPMTRAERLGHSMAFFYRANSNELALLYGDKDFIMPMPNPVMADSEGVFPDIYLARPFRVQIVNRKKETIYIEVVE